jgi:hypothetical protein
MQLNGGLKLQNKTSEVAAVRCGGNFAWCWPANILRQAVVIKFYIHVMTKPTLLFNSSLFILLVSFAAFTGNTINDDNCQNPKFISTENEARSERNKKIKEIEEEHSDEVDGIQHVKSALLMERNEIYLSALNKCGSNDGGCSTMAKKKYDDSVKIIFHKYDSLLNKSQQDEYEKKQAVQNEYIEAIRKAHDLYPNSYEVEKDTYYSGKICDVRKPFEITVTSAELNMKVPFKFVPETDSSGSVSFGFSYQTATAAGGGKYSITGLNTCHPVLVIRGGMTAQGGGISHSSSGETNLKLMFIKDCRQ